MKIVFVADAHLKGPDDPNQADLVKFIDQLNDIKVLVVLGDLFDFWGGNDKVVKKRYKATLEAFSRLRGRGIELLYLEGNHDFAMGPYFVETLKADVHGDSVELAVEDDKRLFLAHGDIIAGGYGHAMWRQSLKRGFMNFLMHSVGPWITWQIAMAMSKKSRQYSEKKDVEDRLREFAGKRIAAGSDAVVLGHSHVPGVHEVESGGKKGTYANPGSWAAGKSYLVYENGEFRVERWG